jgi:predicted nucleotidyltransferase
MVDVNRDQIVEAIGNAFRKDDQGAAVAYLFGSVARGDDRQGSDVDVGVVLWSGRPRRLEDLPVDLPAALEKGLRRVVDLVVLNGAPVELVHRVLRDGIVVHERDRASRVEFEVKARNEWFDLAPQLGRYRRALIARA